MIRLNKILFVIVILIVLIQTNSFSMADPKKPKYGTAVNYWHPTWFTNDKIVYIKEIVHYQYRYDWLADVAKARSRMIKREKKLCSFDIISNEEKVIIEIAATYKIGKSAEYTNENTKFLFSTHSIKCNYKTNTIAVATMDDGWGDHIYILKYNNLDIKKVMDNATAPHFSPDGKKLLVYKYKEGSESGLRVKRKSDLFITDLDGNIIKEIGSSDKYSGAKWHPLGDKIIFSREDPEPTIVEVRGVKKEFYKSKAYVLNLNYGKEELFLEAKGVPTDWSYESSKFLFTNSVYDAVTQKSVYINNIKDWHRLSPDGTKVIGFSRKEKKYEDGIVRPYDSGIYVVNSDNTEPKLLLKE